jgi:nicotinate phosphoribosyltransferase
MYYNQSTMEKIRKGYYSAQYFLNTQKILIQQNNYSSATMQVFQKKNNATLCGIDEVVSLLKRATGIYKEKKWQSMWDKLVVKSLLDGNSISAYEPVLHITGPYIAFAHLESLYLGILARRTLVATNCRSVVNAAKGKPIFFFADRFDHFLNQEGDGYAARIGGVTAVCTEAQAKWFNGKPVGTMPHSLIAMNLGDTVKASKMFLNSFPNSQLIVLVDFENDCVNTALNVARIFGNKLWAVRLDTSENLIDKSIQTSSEPLKNGVSALLVHTVRNALDKAGYRQVKIIVSGGFDQEKIKQFEKDRIPVDGYGVGSALLKGNNDFTADIVKVEGKRIGKEGRFLKRNPRMKQVH